MTKLNDIFGLSVKEHGVSSAPSYVPTLIRELAGDELRAEVPEELASDQWTVLREPNRLARRFNFDDPSILRRFITEVLDFQEDSMHHGRILIEDGGIRVDVWTHDINDVTQADQDYARELSDIYSDVMGIYSNV